MATASNTTTDYMTDPNEVDPTTGLPIERMNLTDMMHDRTQEWEVEGFELIKTDLTEPSLVGFVSQYDGR